jgi:DNA-binding transcriptional ArsR family regulator
MASADSLLHPIRLRIVKALLGDRALTTTELAAELDDVPIASLYRHISRLLNDGVLQVVAEQRIRGAVERTYTLRSAAAQMHPGEIATMSAEDHTHAFMAFIAGALADFDRYIATDPADPVKDGAGYRLAAMWLTDTEYTEFLQDLAAVIGPRVANAPKKQRRRRLLYGIALPDPTQHTNTPRSG